MKFFYLNDSVSRGAIEGSLQWLLTAVAIGLGGMDATAAERRTLTGHVLAEVRTLKSEGRMDPNQPMRLSFSLPWRNPEELQKLLVEQSDPQSTNYRRYLTPAQFTERFGPTETDYRALQEFATSHGLTVTGVHPNRMLLNVNGTAAAVERALSVRLQTYQHPTENRTFYSADSEPSVEEGVPLLDVAGLDNFKLPRPKGFHRTPPQAPRPYLGSGPDSGDYTAKDIRAAYAPNVTQTGVGQAVGLLEFDGFYPGDIAKYRQQAGLAEVPIVPVLLNGFDGTPTKGTTSGNGEVALDIEMVIAMAPGISKILVYETDMNGTGNDLLSRMANDNAAAQLSCSWTFGSGSRVTTDQLFQQLAAQGQSFFTASGDSGSFAGTSIEIPDDSPYITVVGGTTLDTTGPLGGYVSEMVWNDEQGHASSGGISLIYPIPEWQKRVATGSNAASTTHRNVPDVAFLADNVFTVADNGQNEAVVGTSIAAPLWAAFTALVNERAASLGQPPVGFLNPALYSLYRGNSYSTYFRDITQGNNYRPGGQPKYSAAVGFDLCTGIGTPIVSALVSKLAISDPLGITPFAGFSAWGSRGGPFNLTTQAFGLTNSGTGSISWSLGGIPNWLAVSATQGTLANTSSGTLITISLNDQANQLPSGIATASLIFTNHTLGSLQSRTVTIHIDGNLVQNPGFETGDLSYWNLTGKSADAYGSVDDGSMFAGLRSHTGTWAASLGQNFSETSSLGHLAQTLPTVSEQRYLFDFWLSSLGDTNGTTEPNQFVASWEGAALYAVTNSPAFDWTHQQFLVTAGRSGSTIQFGYSNDPGTWALDDVSVAAVMRPTIKSVLESLGSLSIIWTIQAGVTYQVQSSPVLGPASWTVDSIQGQVSGTTYHFTDSAGTNLRKFYRLVVAP